jgi:dihydrofolate reductase
MRKIVASEYVSLNGVAQAPETWHFPFIDDQFLAEINASIHSIDALLLGRTTYEIFAASWPLRTQNEFGMADKLNAMPKHVVSTTLEHTEWNNSSIIRGEHLAEEISRLKRQPGGDIGIMGSAKLVQSLLRLDLIDELRLWVHPIVVNAGAHLFHDGLGSHSMRLLESKTHEKGVVSLLYRPVPALDSAC